MKISHLGLFLLFFCACCCHSQDLAVQIQAMQTQLEKMNQALELQNKTIAQQRGEIEAQKKDLIELKQNAPARRPVINDLMTKLDITDRHHDHDHGHDHKHHDHKHGDGHDHAAHATHATPAPIHAHAAHKKPGDAHMEVGAAVDTSFGYTSMKPADYDRPTGVDFRLRSAHLTFAMEVDQYFKSYMILNASGDSADNDEAIVGVEEAAFETTSFKNIAVKGGRFFTPFGRLSQVHDHDLPFTTRPRSLDNYVGGESGGDGVQVRAKIPIDHFLEITGGAFNKIGGEFPLLTPTGQDRDISELTFLAKALTRFDFCTDSTLEVGVSAIEVPSPRIHRDLTNLELTYKWRPKNDCGLKEKLVVGAELMRNNLRSEFEAAPGPPAVISAERRTGYGGYGYAEYFHTKKWSLGARVDFFQNVDPTIRSGHTDQTYTAFATYRFSECSRMRVEASRHEYFNGRQGNEFLIQWTATWGAHNHD